MASTSVAADGYYYRLDLTYPRQYTPRDMAASTIFEEIIASFEIK